MPERTLLLGLVALALALVVLVARWWARRVAARLASTPADPLWEALGARPDGRTTVVAFSTPSCAACHTAQRPAVEEVQRTLGTPAVRVLHVDAARFPETARRCGGLSVPSTVVLAPDGRVRAVNHGFAPATRLATQARC
jgi:hypothetical protein